MRWRGRWGGLRRLGSEVPAVFYDRVRAGVSVEKEARVKVAESMADRVTPAVDQPRLVHLV